MSKRKGDQARPLDNDDALDEEALRAQGRDRAMTLLSECGTHTAFLHCHSMKELFSKEQKDRPSMGQSNECLLTGEREFFRGWFINRGHWRDLQPDHPELYPDKAHARAKWKEAMETFILGRKAQLNTIMYDDVTREAPSEDGGQAWTFHLDGCPQVTVRVQSERRDGESPSRATDPAQQNDPPSGYCVYGIHEEECPAVAFFADRAYFDCGVEGIPEWCRIGDYGLVRCQAPSPRNSAQDSGSDDVSEEDYLIERGVGGWRVVFNGVEIPGINKAKGMSYVAYLVQHAGDKPLSCVELEAKSQMEYGRGLGISSVQNEGAGKEEPVDRAAILLERNLGIDDAEAERRLRRFEEECLADLKDPKKGPKSKEIALERIMAVKEWRFSKGLSDSNEYDLSAKRVRTAIGRLCDSLEHHRAENNMIPKSAHQFAEYVRNHILNPSRALWPRGGRVKRRGVLAGHFKCLKDESIAWTVRR